MAIVDQADLARSIATDLLRHTARCYPDVDPTTVHRALTLAAAELQETIRARPQDDFWNAAPPRASANPWQIEYD